jgi:chemotaxis protein CheX
MPIKITVEHINPFLKASIETYSAMLACNIKPGKLSQKKTVSEFSINGIISLSGDVSGFVAMTYPEKSSLSTVSRFIGEEIPEMCDDISDAIGELVNIVAGYAKKFLTLNIHISLPTVTAEADIPFEADKSLMKFYIPFESEIGNFTVILALK